LWQTTLLDVRIAYRGTILFVGLDVTPGLDAEARNIAGFQSAVMLDTYDRLHNSLPAPEPGVGEADVGRRSTKSPACSNSMACVKQRAAGLTADASKKISLVSRARSARTSTVSCSIRPLTGSIPSSQWFCAPTLKLH